MLSLKILTDAFAAAPQMLPEDLAAAAAAGYRSVVVNRPDGETPDQPPQADMEAAAAAAGLTFAALPVVGSPSPAQGAAFADLLDALPGPTLAYCRSGTRSTMLWALAQAQRGTMAPEAILATAQRQGYDLSALAATLRQLSSQAD